MTDRIYYKELDCYHKASKRYDERYAYYDLSTLPTETMREEFKRFLISEGTRVSMNTITQQKTHYTHLNKVIELSRKKPSSFNDWSEKQWIQSAKLWMMQNGVPFYEKKINAYGNQGYREAALLRYLRSVLRFLQPEDTRPEQEKDIWKIDKLGIPIEKNPIYNMETLNFTKIQQPGIREEVKRAVYLNLKMEKLGTIQTEIGAIRKFSKYLKESNRNIESCSEIDRELIEDYLVYLSTNGSSGRSNSTTVLNLRKILEMVGKIFGYPHLERLFMNTDIPPEVQPSFKSYSDTELKRLNAHITKLDVQLTRCLVIHQMLGTRISDTLTLKKDCLKKQNGLDIIRIDQVKTRTFEKPISAELAALIRKAVDCTKERYGETEYIFVDDKDISRPLQYITIKSKVLTLINQEDLKDDNGKRFTFNTHMFRRSYGVKLTELHLDDWTIAKLLGHSNINSVRHYRKMSNQILADETRKAREMQTRILLENLSDWEEDYEQLRQYART